MDDRTKTTKAKSEAYSPEQYIRDLKAVADKALKAGVNLATLAHATMGFAHSVWDECYGDSEATGELLDAIKQQHPNWDNINNELKNAGYPIKLD